MRAIFKSKAKYLLLIPIIIFILSTFYFKYASDRIAGVMLEEKRKDVANHLTMFKKAMDATEDRPWEDYEPNVAACTAFINSMENTYSWAYKRVNGEWKLLSDWKGPTAFLKLREEIFEKADGQTSGSFFIDYAPEGGPSRRLHISFEQMPMYASQEERYLIFTGISVYSLASVIPSRVSAGQWASMIISLCMNILLLAWIANAMRDEQKSGTGSRAPEGAIFIQ